MVDREIFRHSSMNSNTDISKISKTVQRDLTIIFDVLSEYVVVNLIFLAVAFRDLSVYYLLDLSGHRPPVLGPMPSCSVNIHVISSNLKQVV